MTATKNYPKEFVARTILLFDKVEMSAKKEGLEVTFLLNCLLGLIVSVLENIDKLDKSDFDKSFFAVKLNSDELKGIIPLSIKAIKDIDILNSYKEQINSHGFLKEISEECILIKSSTISFIPKQILFNYDLIWLLRKIRNGIAHQNIMPTSESDTWKGIRLWNHNPQGIKNFAIEFNISELRKFSKEIAERYLKSID
jgi:hypothetical protein